MSQSPTNADLCWKCKNPVQKARVNMNSSELFTRFRSEYGTHASSAQQVDEVVDLCNKDLEDYEAEIARLQGRILLLQKKQKHLRIYRTNVRFLSSPVRRLPDEVLSIIFEFACDRNLIQEYPWSLDQNPPPTNLKSPAMAYIPVLSISSTCSRWRSIAKSPSLWSKLQLEITSKAATPEQPDPFMEILDLFLSRSAQRLLEIKLSIIGDPQGTPLALEVLAQHTSRWKVFEFEATSLDNRRMVITEYLNTNAHLDFPNLEKLSIGNASSGVLDIFRSAPKIRRLRNWFITLPSQLPYAQLTHIACWAVSGRLDNLLDQCPNLLSLELRPSRKRNGSFHSMIHKTSDTIKFLTLVDNSATTDRLLELALSSLTLSELKELCIRRELSYNGYDAGWPKDLFTSFLSRSSCQLTKLVISSIGLSDTDLIAALQLLPSLVILQLDDNDASPKISPITSNFICALEPLGALERSISNSTLIPKLRYLSLNFSGNEFDDLGFISMISSRWLLDSMDTEITGVERIRSVEMRFQEREVDATVYQPLQLLDRMGLRVTVCGMNDTKI
ncbi:hypothetical protein GYMLUDRAFT_88395 [Collybiopsis luxurians FD-317 M1]|uniref:F-box domain-containing protein n=1 Tax=Collybiopsis luxurians FD-317 M1 TaxID=944289 RepID=A0A0D0C647_9AGAR|nr:hypothetical protein GYMLUDRAFT_88395 [Collybiopsis luxurians FD-317 M1]